MGITTVYYRVKKERRGNKIYYYLVKEWYDPDEKRKKMISLGNCEKIEKVVRGVGFEPTQAYAIGASARRRRKKQGVSFPSHVAITGEAQAEKFMKWCIENGSSRETCEQYVRYLRKPLNKDNKWSVLAYKKWAKYTGNDELWRQLKTKQSKIDLWVPSDSEIREALDKACESSEELCLAYHYLIETGARLEEVIKMMNELDEEKIVELDGFYAYPLGYIRGSKYSFYLFTVTKPRQYRSSAKWISNWCSKKAKVVCPKYIRKWVATKMVSIGIPAEVVNFIQGRTPRKILEQRYLYLYALALQFYPRYANYLKEVGLVEG